MNGNKLYAKVVKKRPINYEKFADLAKCVVENEVLIHAGKIMEDGSVYTPTDEATEILILDFATNMAYGSAYTRNKYLAIGGFFGITATIGVVIGMKLMQKKERDEEC